MDYIKEPFRKCLSLKKLIWYIKIHYQTIRRFELEKKLVMWRNYVRNKKINKDLYAISGDITVIIN